MGIGGSGSGEALFDLCGRRGGRVRGLSGVARKDVARELRCL